MATTNRKISDSLTSSPSVVCEGSSVYDTKQAASIALLYNAGALDTVEEQFERAEGRRLAKAKHAKTTRKLSKSDSWN